MTKLQELGMKLKECAVLIQELRIKEESGPTIGKRWSRLNVLMWHISDCRNPKTCDDDPEFRAAMRGEEIKSKARGLK